MISRITQWFNWPNVFCDVADYCWSYPEFQKTARGSQLKIPEPLPVMKEPFEQIHSGTIAM